MSAAVQTADIATTPTSDISPTTSRGAGSLIGGLLDCVLDTVGATAAIFAAAGCGSLAEVAGATAAIFAAAGCGSAAVFAGFAILVDVAVDADWRGLWRVRGFGGSSLSEADADVLSEGVVPSSVLVDGSVVASEGFGESAFDSFEADEPSEFELPAEDEPSA